MDEFLFMHSEFLKIPKNIIEKKDILYNFAFDILLKTNDMKVKEEVLSKLIQLFPEDPILYYKMANLVKSTSSDKAIMWHKIAYALKPDLETNLVELFELFFERGNYEHMQHLNKNNLFEKFLHNPKFVGMLVRSRFSLAQYENAIKYMKFLIQNNSQKPAITYEDKLEKYNNYHDTGYMYSHVGDITNSLKYMEKAIDLSNKFNLPLQSKLLSLQSYLYLHDFIYNDNSKIFEKFLQINALLPDKPLFSFEHRIKNKTNKIKIGYLSSDFNPHSVANFILPILKHHDKSKFDIYLFSNHKNMSQLFSELKLPTYFICNISAEESAKLIYNKQIDILFDLNGHTSNNRLDVFRHHPAPIQISYLGYANTTGLTGIHYRLTDFIADHPESTQQFSEQLIRMPGCFLLFNPLHKFIIEPKKTNKDRIILGSTHKEAKLNDHVFSVWKQILDQCPNTVLFIKLESFDNVVERTEYYIKKMNIDADRIIIRPQLFDDAYDHLYKEFDILLDTFPYSGTTITCNCLFNSLPVVSLYDKNSHAHNVSSSLLINSGLSELIAHSQKEYINIVVDLVNNPEKIDHYKSTIRKKFLGLMEPVSFMKKYEDVLTKIYNNDIQSFLVPSIQTSSSDNITIDFSDTPIINNSEKLKNVYICGTLNNCTVFLDKVFSNIDKLIGLFNDYKIIICYDNMNEKSLDKLEKKKAKYNMELIHVLENEDIFHIDMRSQRISNARNEYLKYIRKENKDDFEYFIVMDMDDVCAGNIDLHAITHHLKNNSLWDALSFNKPHYYDIWALSIEPYLLSCWHFPYSKDIVHAMENYVSDKLNTLDKYDLLECQSAFNGFAIYKKSKFIDCEYNWRIKNIRNYVNNDQVKKNEEALGKTFSINTSYHSGVHAMTDCEHRQFHMEAIRKHNAKIRISPICLFT
jgi:predicted O-linked N-acetylglucosamine transferase (SPINDLY family)/ssDNA-binding Zn-finger/Zn-ribbon topoisomerase 1